MPEADLSAVKLYDPEQLPLVEDPVEQLARDLLWRANIGRDTVAGKLLVLLLRRTAGRPGVLNGDEMTLASIKQACCPDESDSALRKGLARLKDARLIEVARDGRQGPLHVGVLQRNETVDPEAKTQRWIDSLAPPEARQPVALGVVQTSQGGAETAHFKCAPKVRTQSAHLKCALEVRTLVGDAFSDSATESPPSSNPAITSDAHESAHFKCALQVRTSPERPEGIRREEEDRSREVNNDRVDGSEPDTPDRFAAVIVPPDLEFKLEASTIYERLDKSNLRWVALTAVVARANGWITPERLEQLIVECRGAENFGSRLKEDLGRRWLSRRDLKRLLPSRGIAWKRMWDLPERPRAP